MVSHCKANGNPRPLFEEKAGAFVITFFRQPDEGINDVFHFIQNNHGLRTTQLCAALGIAPKTIERWISMLKSDGKIEFRGSKKTGGYYATLNP